MTTEQTSRPITVEPERCESLLRQFVSIRSVVGEDTTAHQWLTAQLKGLGMTVEHYAVEGRRTPLVLGVLEGDGDRPGVMFDGHYDTVSAFIKSLRGNDPDGALYWLDTGKGNADGSLNRVAL